MLTWIKGNGTRIGNIYTGTYSGGGLYVNANGTVSGYYDWSSAGALISTTKVNDSTWHQIVFQSDGDTSFIYVDGKLEVKKAERMYRTVMANPNAKFHIGKSFQRAYPIRDYDIDRFIIYRDVLSLKQIDSLNKIGCPCNCKKDTVFIHDTLRLTDTIIRYDTLRVTDTIIIRDTVILELSIDNEIHELELALYPNPTNKYLKITGVRNSANMNIYNISGQVMNNVSIIEENESHILIEISLLQEGLYFLVVDQHTVRFIKTE